MSLKERSPEDPDRIRASQIIETETNVTTRRTPFTVDGRPKAITTLHSERRVEALNISILTAQWTGGECKQTRT